VAPAPEVAGLLRTETELIQEVRRINQLIDSDGDILGRVVQVDPVKPKLKLPGTKRLKLKCHVLRSTSAFRFNLRRYTLMWTLNA